MMTLGLAATATTSSSKKRKINGADEVELIKFPVIHRVVKKASTSADQICPGDKAVTEDERICASDHESASCCSSNGSSARRRNTKFTDLEPEASVEVEAPLSFYSSRERMETTSWLNQIGAEEGRQAGLSGNLDSPARPSSPSEANSRRLRSSSSTVAAKMPTHLELEDFFSEAEKKLQTQFAAK
ncbi:hypothetical protein Tsubulata_032387 [Turnera subulata]|uniref:Cyclin-dependent kinase inhibitor n=1 Tax=Turnera subulata TaxID=218843 RepID=A0A9Q0JN50_9ROSI|nr:hypothetical protein Tsubulata_032387 [Turnera subulata]